MNYQESLQYLHGVARFGSKPGLTRVSALLEAMGEPHKGLRCIHIAGTNGKGSTAAMTERMLREAGYSTGLCTSPYLLDFCERIRINGDCIDRDELAVRMTALKQTVERLVADGGPQPTEFELVVALTLQCFAEHKLDYCVIEVGLGGRWDATNVIEPPLVAAITSISFDHTEYLGDTLRQIALEKCGILKPGSQFVASHVQSPEVLEVFAEAAARCGAPLTLTDLAEIQSADASGTRFVYHGRNYTTPLAGIHQVHNALVALEIVEALRRQGADISYETAARGLAQTQWAGRLQVVGRDPLMLLDVAHNPDGVRALCEALDTLYAGKRIVAVVGMCGDKKVDRCVPLLARRVAAFFAVTADNPRALPAPELATLAAPYCRETVCADSVTEGVQQALACAGQDDVVLICGSLFIMAEAVAASGG